MCLSVHVDWGMGSMRHVCLGCVCVYWGSGECLFASQGTEGGAYISEVRREDLEPGSCFLPIRSSGVAVGADGSLASSLGMPSTSALPTSQMDGVRRGPFSPPLPVLRAATQQPERMPGVIFPSQVFGGDISLQLGEGCGEPCYFPS